MIKRIKLLGLILSFFIIQTSQAQDVTVQLIDLGIGTFQQIIVSDFDFLEAGGAEELFKIRITNNTGNQYNQSVLRFELWEGQVGVGTLLARIVTEGFTIPGAMSSWEITNQQLANGENVEGLGIIGIEESGVESDADDLRDEIVATSQIPTGLYNLAGYLNIPGSGNIETIPIPIIISNPTLLNLVTPGALINSGFKYEIFTENPLFQWNGNSGEYQVVVFKKRNDFDTIEDILNSVPVWESERLNTLVAQYPVGESVPLEYGSDYVWQVLSFINTSSGENVVRSEIFEFTLVDPAQSNYSQIAMAKQELEQILRQILGDSAETIIRQINDFKLNTIRVNGATLSIPELYQVLEKYRDQEYDVYDIFLRSSN
jgi:hypothetical protein